MAKLLNLGNQSKIEKQKYIVIESDRKLDMMLHIIICTYVYYLMNNVGLVWFLKLKYINHLPISLS